MRFQNQLADKDILIMVFQKFMWNRSSKRAPNSIFFLSLDVLRIYFPECQNLSDKLILRRSYRLQNMSSIFHVEKCYPYVLLALKGHSLAVSDAFRSKKRYLEFSTFPLYTVI